MPVCVFAPNAAPVKPALCPNAEILTFWGVMRNSRRTIAIYSTNTTFADLTIPVDDNVDQNSTPLSVISTDHLPLMLPREASEAFSEGLKEALLMLKDRKTHHAWADAEKLFDEKVA